MASKKKLRCKRIELDHFHPRTPRPARMAGRWKVILKKNPTNPVNPVQKLKRKPHIKSVVSSTGMQNAIILTPDGQNATKNQRKARFYST